MILIMPFRNNEVVDFDTSTCDINKNVDANAKTQGSFHILQNRKIALYAEEGQLYLQIDFEKWTFASDEIFIRYGHDLIKKASYFEVKWSKGKRVMEYPAWWAEIPGFQPVEPEMDEDEDYLGYVFSVWKNPDLQKKLLERWS